MNPCGGRSLIPSLVALVALRPAAAQRSAGAADSFASPEVGQAARARWRGQTESQRDSVQQQWKSLYLLMK